MSLTIENNLGRLRRKAEPVDQFGPRLESLVQHFWDTMSYHKLPILSGPEVDVPLRIVTLDTSLGMDSACRVVLINPEIAEESRALEEANEGCACVPEVTAIVARPAHVVVEALDCEGKRNELVFESVEARLICHECDGLLCYDARRIGDSLNPKGEKAHV